MKRIERHILDTEDEGECCNTCGEQFDLYGAFYDYETCLLICIDCAIEIDPDLEWRMNG